MSYISTMKVNDGLVMLADMQMCRGRGLITTVNNLRFHSFQQFDL